jgi:DNA-binding beta-propeller fold protein YncE
VTLLKKLFLLILFALPVSNIFSQKNIQYFLDKTIPITGDGSYDYLSIDHINHHLFVSHGTVVNVIDLNTEEVIATIDSMKGVHGIAVVNEVNKGFITDGKDNAVIVFDLTSFKTIKRIQLSGKKPDAITYDPFSKKVFAFCGDSNEACVIDINDLTQTGVVSLGGAPEFAVPDKKGLIYNNLEDKSSLVIIDTKAMKVSQTYPLSPCGGPTGLALDEKHKRIFTACRENKGMSVVDINNGKVITTIPIGAGVDAAVYDEADQLIFCSNADATVTIIKQTDADNYAVIQTLATQYRAKTMTFDDKTGKIYLSAPKFDDNKKPLSGTFTVLVYKQTP